MLVLMNACSSRNENENKVIAFLKRKRKWGKTPLWTLYKFDKNVRTKHELAHKYEPYTIFHKNVRSEHSMARSAEERNSAVISAHMRPYGIRLFFATTSTFTIFLTLCCHTPPSSAIDIVRTMFILQQIGDISLWKTRSQNP